MDMPILPGWVGNAMFLLGEVCSDLVSSCQLLFISKF